MEPARFVVLGELARGGMGRVDLAYREGDPSALLAVKRIHRHLVAEEEIVRMFVAEAKLLDALHHPNIVHLVDFGTDDDGFFIATELLNGASLAQLARWGRSAGEPIPEELIGYIGATVGGALAAAHSLRNENGDPVGIIHRDISPDNVLVGLDGDVKISDFGISKSIFKSTRTATGVLRGKIHYMSPEIATGHPIDPRTDLFSLGVVLYWLATGEFPFDGDHEREVLRNIVEATPRPIVSIVPAFDRGLATTIERLLSKHAEDRAPGDARGLAEELGGWLDRRGVSRDLARRQLAAYVERHGERQRRKIAGLVESDARSPSATDEASSERPPIEDVAPFLERSEAARPLSPGTRKVQRPEPAPPDSEGAIARTSIVAPPARSTRMHAVGALSLTLVLALAAGAIFHATRGTTATREPIDVPLVGTEEAAVAASVASAASAPSAPSVASVATAASRATASPPSLSSEGPPKARAGPKPARPMRPARPSSPARGCTPGDWDYPRCLQGR